MVALVLGFPSNIAALQFEWAWHNPHLTRHIAQDDRVSHATVRVKTNYKTGKTRKKLGRPRTSLTDKLSNLHLLLRAPYFSAWPLELRFFDEKVYKSWKSCNEKAEEKIRPGISILLDLPEKLEDDGEFSSAQRPTKRRKVDLIGKGGVEGIDPTYARFQEPLQRLRALTENKPFKPMCDICDSSINMEEDLFNICLGKGCHSLTHLSCLSSKFLETDATNLLVPSGGTCPSCDAQLKWSELMCMLSLRIRGQKEVNKLLKKANRGAAAIAAELLEDDEDSDSEQSADELDPVDIEEVDIEAMDSDEHEEVGNTSATVVSAIDTTSKPPMLLANGFDPGKFDLEIVIADSEDED